MRAEGIVETARRILCVFPRYTSSFGTWEYAYPLTDGIRAFMIEKLNRGLTVEFALVAIFIGLAFRSWVVTFACILPGIFPVVMSGTLLYLLGEGLQFASVVALTVSFGLGLSATIHFLNRLRLESKPGVTSDIAVERATVLVGPALILTTLVLACRHHRQRSGPRGRSSRLAESLLSACRTREGAFRQGR